MVRKFLFLPFNTKKEIVFLTFCIGSPVLVFLSCSVVFFFFFFAFCFYFFFIFYFFLAREEIYSLAKGSERGGSRELYCSQEYPGAPSGRRNCRVRRKRGNYFWERKREGLKCCWDQCKEVKEKE